MKKTSFLKIFIATSLMMLFICTSFILSSIDIHAYEIDQDSCPHNPIDQTKYDYPADCMNVARRDTVCTKCGKVISSIPTGNKQDPNYGNKHIFDYEDLVSIEEPHSESSCTTFMYTVLAKFKCKVCGEIVRVTVGREYLQTSVFQGLAYHTKLDTSVKKCDDPAEPYTYKCGGCGQDVVCLIQSERPYLSNSDPIDPPGPTEHTHEYIVKNTIAPSCSSKGLTQYECKVCGETKSEYIDELGHNYGPYVITKNPTCKSEGVQTSTCTRCSATQTMSVPMTTHSFSSTPRLVIDSTCSKEGVKIYKCDNCDEMHVDIIPINEANHRFDTDWKVTIEGTCVVQRVISNTCADCGKNETKTGDYGEHKYVLSDSKEASCTTDGFKKYTCEHCHESYTDEVNATGHSFKESVDEKGNVTNLCSGCGMMVSNTVKNNQVIRSIAVGAFRIDIVDPSIVYKDPASIDIMIKRITKDDSSYESHVESLSKMNLSSQTNYSIQDLVTVSLLVDGKEYSINDKMTLYWFLDSELNKSKLNIIYYPDGENDASISYMKNSVVKSTVITIPGAEYAKSSDGVIVLAISGDAVNTSGDAVATLGDIPTGGGQSNPKPAGNKNTTLIILLIVGIVVLLGVGVAVFMLFGKKKKMNF